MTESTSSETPSYIIRPATAADIEQVIRLDTEITAVPKPEYWQDLFRRYGDHGGDRYFLVAMQGNLLVGFIIGEVRAWEFGSPPCGWIFAINVDPESRLGGLGTELFDAVCADFKKAGVTKVRTMLARDDQLVMSFFRSQGMMAGPFTELEKDLD